MSGARRWVSCVVLRVSKGEEYELSAGFYPREAYLNPELPSYIQGINTDIPDVDQLYMFAQTREEAIFRLCCTPRSLPTDAEVHINPC